MTDPLHNEENRERAARFADKTVIVFCTPIAVWIVFELATWLAQGAVCLP